MSNLTGVTGDARKRLEAAMVKPPFNMGAQCIVCGQRGVHTHALACGNQQTSRIVVVPDTLDS